MSDNYEEETKPLFKMLRTEAFRFIIVRYNHFSFVQQLEKDIHRLFPNRPFLKIDARNIDYERLTKNYFSINNGFIFLLNFDDVLREQFDSQHRETPQYKIDNERRRGITAGLNLRRDKLAKSPIALFIFVPASIDELYAKTIMEKMPDLWSFRSIMIDLVRERAVIELPKIDTTTDLEIVTQNIKEEDTELKRLLSLLENAPENEKAYRLTLYPQIVKAANETGRYELAFSMLNDWEIQAEGKEKPWIWTLRGDILTIYGKIKEALDWYEKAYNLAQKQDEKGIMSLSLERLGSVHTSLGNLEQALTFFEECNRIERQLYAVYRSNVDFKYSLAISYSKLGDTHSALGNLAQALRLFEEENRLFRELYLAHPTDLSLKEGLSISYEKLGSANMALGNLEKALNLFESSYMLSSEIYANYPNNVEFKKNLAISYEKLGDIYTALGNLDKALDLFEKRTTLGKELYIEYSENTLFKNGLAISYSKLGETHFALGNLEQALTFFEERNKLGKELYASFPSNVPFKNGLAISYAKLGEISLKKEEKTQAQNYFKQAEALWLELVRDAPQYVQFQQLLRQVQKDIEKLEKEL